MAKQAKTSKDKSSWHVRVMPYTTLLSAVIAVCGLLFGIYQFEKGRQKDRAAQERDQSIRIQNQIRADLDQILTFTQDKQQTSARVSFLLADLKSYLDIEAKDGQAGSEDANARIRKVSAVLVKAMVADCNFEEHRDVNFANTLLDDWEDTGQYLKGDPTSQSQIIDKLGDAILNIYVKDPKVISTAEMSGDDYLYVSGYGTLTPSDISYFQDMVSAYKRLFKDINTTRMKEAKALRFQMSTCNPDATKNFFDIKFDPKGIPELCHCVPCRLEAASPQGH